MQDIKAKASKIRLVIFDVDGVLTDGRLFFDGQGNEYKTFHAWDGLGMKLLMQTGVEVAVISGRQSDAVTHRMKNLGIQHIYQGQLDKNQAFDALSKELNLNPEQIAHVGDDLLDICLMRRVGLAIAVANAHPSTLPYADWRTQNPGGQGAAREVCDLIMEAQGNLQGVIEQYL